MSTKFLVAKFAPDLRRMEPKNIGVVVWRNGEVDARFVGEDDRPPRSLGVQDGKNFKLWLQSWRLQLTKTELELDGGKTVDRTSPQFLDSLREWSRGNYMLVDGGELIEDNDESLDAVISHLFNELVQVKDAAKAAIARKR